jgi:hypothetical protein
MTTTPDQDVQTPDVTPVTSAGSAAAGTGVRRIVGRIGWLDRIAVALLLVGAAILVASVRQVMYLPFWYNEQWRAWHISRSIGGELWRELPYSDSPIAVGWLLVEKAATLAFGEVEAAYRWPVACCLPLLALSSYVLARRWLGPLGSFLTVALLIANPLLYNYVWQLAPYLCEAMLAPLAVLLWLKAADWEHRPALRLAAYVGVGLCAVFGTAITFIVASLLLLDLAGWLRTRAWPPFVPALVAGLITVGHLALFVLPQSKGAVTEYWVGSYAPRSLAAASFFVHNLDLFVSQLIASPVPTDRVLPLLFWLALAMGSVVAVRDRRLRPLFVAVAGTLVLQLAASSIQRWAFGPVRINYFLIPLVYLIAAVGISRLAQPLTRRLRSNVSVAAHRAALAGLSVLAGGVLTAFVAASMINAIGLRDVRRLNLGAHPYDGMRDLALAARPFVDTKDLVVFAQHPVYENFKGWAYYMSAYGGWPQGVARQAALPPDRSLQVQGHDPSQSRRFLAAHPGASQILSVTMRNATPQTVRSVTNALRDAGLRPTQRVDAARTGNLTIWASAHPSRISRPLDKP